MSASHSLTISDTVWTLTLNAVGSVNALSYGASQSLSSVQRNQALENLQIFDATDTIANGAKFEPNPDGGLDLALFDQGTNTFRRVRLNNGTLIVE